MGASVAEQLNQNCFCMTLDREALRRAFLKEIGDPCFWAEFIEGRPNLFSNTPVFVPRHAIQKMHDIVSAIEDAASMPAYQHDVLLSATEIARHDHGPIGILMGYDFHLGENGPKLIEVNTNAGGAFLNALLARAQLTCCKEMEGASGVGSADEFDGKVVRMFQDEWRRQRGASPIGRIAIVDDSPQDQYLYPEFVLVRQMLRSAGIEAFIVDPKDLAYESGRLFSGGLDIGFVYNRLVDFDLALPAHASLRRAYMEGSVVVSPNP